MNDGPRRRFRLGCVLPLLSTGRWVVALVSGDGIEPSSDPGQVNGSLEWLIVARAHHLVSTAAAGREWRLDDLVPPAAMGMRSQGRRDIACPQLPASSDLKAWLRWVFELGGQHPAGDVLVQAWAGVRRRTRRSILVWRSPALTSSSSSSVRNSDVASRSCSSLTSSHS